MRYDIIVVGAGSAGNVLATRLSADPTRSVLLLEAGPSDWHPFVHMPAGVAKLVGEKGVNWDYNTAPDPNRHTVVSEFRAPENKENGFLKIYGGRDSIKGDS